MPRAPCAPSLGGAHRGGPRRTAKEVLGTAKEVLGSRNLLGFPRIVNDYWDFTKIWPDSDLVLKLQKLQKLQKQKAMFLWKLLGSSIEVPGDRS